MRGGAFEATTLLLGMSDSLLAGVFGGTDILEYSKLEVYSAKIIKFSHLIGFIFIFFLTVCPQHGHLNVTSQTFLISICFIFCCSIYMLE